VITVIIFAILTVITVENCTLYIHQERVNCTLPSDGVCVIGWDYFPNPKNSDTYVITYYIVICYNILQCNMLLCILHCNMMKNLH
jgi:hypothetical protein